MQAFAEARRETQTANFPSSFKYLRNYDSSLHKLLVRENERPRSHLITRQRERGRFSPEVNQRERLRAKK